MTDWSLNEIAVLSRKAARGAGMAWGLAEEAGDAVRWLEERGLPGCRALAGSLVRRDGCGTPRRDGIVWTAQGAALCPVTLGAAIADDPVRLEGFRARAVIEPILLAPFVAWAGRPATLAWDSAVLSIRNGTLRLAGNALSGTPVDVVAARASGQPRQPTIRSRADVDASTLTTLDLFAQRTYAPATEASRRTGAGGGDAND